MAILKSFPFLIAALAVPLATCGPAPSDNTIVQPPSTPTYKRIDGYREIKLGSTFENAIASLDSNLFNPYSLRECFDELALEGCNLHADRNGAFWELREGIPYGLELGFNKQDELTDLTLTYARDHRINGDQCRDILARTIDWVARDYGPLTMRSNTPGVID